MEIRYFTTKLLALTFQLIFLNSTGDTVGFNVFGNIRDDKSIGYMNCSARPSDILSQNGVDLVVIDILGEFL